MKLKEFVEKHLVEEVMDLNPDTLMLCVRQVKPDGEKQWHYFYVFDDNAWGTGEDVVGAAYTLLDITVERRRKMLKNADRPNKE